MHKSVISGLIFVVCLSFSAFAQDLSGDFVSVDVAEKAIPSLVSIESLSVIQTQLVSFGMARQQAILKDIGTGIILDRSGHILCKNDLVDDVEIVRVTLYDGTQVDGEVLVNDRHYDIALIKIKPDGLNLIPVKTGNAKSVVPGDSAICIGNSAGFKGTVTYGVISALRDYRTPNRVLVPKMIQADCAVNSGNTGGILFNWKGEMIGIHSNPGMVRGDMANINFFLPTDLVMRLCGEMIRTNERAFRPYLGILPYGRYAQGLDDDLRMYFDLPEEFWEVGVLIEDTDENGPAMEHGLLRNDLIVRVEPSPGHQVLVKSIGELEKMIQGWRDGQIVVFSVLRRNTIVEVPVEIWPAHDDVEPYFI
ncbi:serine protease [bacterium]|nr:serine protease [bacterium]